MHQIYTRWILAIACAAAPMTGCGDDGGGDEDSSTSTMTNPTATNPTDVDPTGGEMTTTGGDTSGGVQMVSYTADIQPIWDAKCTVGCHTTTGSASTTGVFLEPATSYMTTVNKASVTVPSLMIVKPSDTAGSYLWHKLNGTYLDVGGSGSPMPIGTPLTADELELIELWIDGGAQP